MCQGPRCVAAGEGGARGCVGMSVGVAEGMGVGVGAREGMCVGGIVHGIGVVVVCAHTT